jgi:hypothetical protein
MIEVDAVAAMVIYAARYQKISQSSRFATGLPLDYVRTGGGLRGK